MSRSALRLRVSEIADVDDDIRAVTLVPEVGQRLSGFPPGSHIGVQWREGRSNFYSLTNDGHDPDAYRIAVHRRDDGAGGSRWVHQLQVGEVVRATPPRSAFAPAASGRHHILISGGVGLTPMISHARWHRTWGGSFEAWHVGPENEILAELRAVTGGFVSTFKCREDFWSEFAQRLVDAPFGSHIYTCGPAGMIADVAEAAHQRGWAAGRVHSESFGVPAVDGEPFTAVAQRSGLRIAVGADTPLLDALESAGIATSSMCRNGVCGKCLTRVVNGRVDHRDSYLSVAEREAQDVMMPCVSRALDEEVVLDL
ncbi:putative Phthalate 4,5-dioxygenase [metagenome]|uniref:Putative Phthalate 4,5-dioxygenase n=1 Tax=metagenome TaxID=256318 RepID=A0A2P2C8M5_9ZZZZ